VSHLASVRGEPDYTAHVPRLLAYKQAHPHVEVLYFGAYWQAIIPEDGGTTVCVRYTLHELMDKLESLAAAGPAGPPAARDAAGR
jgi:hypothetical protein